MAKPKKYKFFELSIADKADVLLAYLVAEHGTSMRPGESFVDVPAVALEGYYNSQRPAMTAQQRKVNGRMVWRVTAPIAKDEQGL